MKTIKGVSRKEGMNRQNTEDILNHYTTLYDTIIMDTYSNS